jgi:hypothetical protein
MLAGSVLAGTIEARQATLDAGEEGWTLSAEFTIDLGPRFEEAVSRGVPLNFVLEFVLSRPRWYWTQEHVAGRRIEYRLTYNALVRQYRLTTGATHQNFATLDEALQVLSRTQAVPVIPRSRVHVGETYTATVRLVLDKSQLPKPLQVDALDNREWKVDSKLLNWQFTVPAEAK